MPSVRENSAHRLPKAGPHQPQKSTTRRAATRRALMPGMKKTMDEWKKGKLHSGSKKGPIVKNQKQAIAIGLSEQRKAKGNVKLASLAK
jgi:hypothetical protein